MITPKSLYKGARIAIVAPASCLKVEGEEREISTPESQVKVFIIPTNEELMIAKQTEKIVK